MADVPRRTPVRRGRDATPKTYDVWLRSGGANKLQVVKVVKDATGLGLKEAKDLVDQAPNVVREGLSLATAEDLKKQLRDAGADVEVTASGVAPEAPWSPPPASTEASGTYSVVLRSGGANKLQVVKVVKDATGLGLKEAKDLVDQAPNVVREGLDAATAEDLKKHLRDAGADVEVTASGVAPEAPWSPPPASTEASGTYSVVLRSGGANKLQVVKVVKDATGLGLKDAKDLVDQAPNVVREGLDLATAEDLKKQLTDAGADVEVTRA